MDNFVVRQHLPTSSTQLQQQGHVLGCKTILQGIAEGLQTWLEVRWLRQFEVARDFQLQLQTGPTPQLAQDAQLQSSTSLSIFENQLEVKIYDPKNLAGSRQLSALLRVVDTRYREQPVWLELASKQATVTLTANQDIEQDAAQHGLWRGNMSPYPLVTCLQEALRAAGVFPVHGACARSPKGDTVLFLGASGTGKTTTLVRALQVGWSAVAEDVVWLEVGTQRTYSLETGLRVFEETLPQLDVQLAKQAWGELVMGKALLPYETLASYYGGTQVQGTPLSHIVHLTRSQSNKQSASTWQPLEKRQLAVALWQGLGMPLTPLVRQQLAEHVPRWLKAVHGWQLNLGDDVAETLRRGVPKP